jgi:hypothetical protein
MAVGQITQAGLAETKTHRFAIAIHRIAHMGGPTAMTTIQALRKANPDEPQARSSGSSLRRGLLRSWAAASLAAVFVAVGVGAMPAQAKSSGKTLLKDPLSQASAAMPDATTPAPGYVGSFVKGKFLLQNTGSHADAYSPTFDATAAQLGAIRVDIDVSLATVGTIAGLNCRAGDTLDTRYVFLIRGGGTWVVGKSVAPSTNTPLAQGSAKVRPNQTVHLRAECSGPAQPGPAGTVAVRFFINGKKVATINDSKSALPVVLPAAVGMEVGANGAASFSNIAVAQL